MELYQVLEFCNTDDGGGTVETILPLALCISSTITDQELQGHYPH